MRSPTLRRQRTFTVDGEKITIVTTRLTQQANLAGWKVVINGHKYKRFVLTRQEAEDSAFVAWVKDHAGGNRQSVRGLKATTLTLRGKTMARKKFKKGVKCSATPTMKKVGNQMRCVCVADNGQWQFLPSDKCKR